MPAVLNLNKVALQWRRTKIVATLGPAASSPGIIELRPSEEGIVDSAKSIGGGERISCQYRCLHKDVRDAKLAMELGADFVALSFVCTPGAALALRRLMSRHGATTERTSWPPKCSNPW